MSYSEPARTPTRRLLRILVATLPVVIVAIAAVLGLPDAGVIIPRPASPTDTPLSQHRGQIVSLWTCDSRALKSFRDQGSGPIQFLDLLDADFVATTSLLQFAGPPHPAAARLFANWVLTANSQTILPVKRKPTAPARTCSPSSPGGAASSAAYYEPDRQSNHAHATRVEQLVGGYLG